MEYLATAMGNGCEVVFRFGSFSKIEENAFSIVDPTIDSDTKFNILLFIQQMTRVVFGLIDLIAVPTSLFSNGIHQRESIGTTNITLNHSNRRTRG